MKTKKIRICNSNLSLTLSLVLLNLFVNGLMMVKCKQFSPGFVCVQNNGKRNYNMMEPFKESSSGLQMGLFNDLFKDAFANDENLSSDKATGQLEYEGDSENDDNIFPILSKPSEQQTDIQKRWLAVQEKEKNVRKQSQLEQQQRNNAAISSGANLDIKGIKGAPVNIDQLIGTTWVLDLYLAGVPERDPSNDLYGSKVNISNRDRSLGLGAAIPEERSISVQITFEKDGICRAESTEYTTGETGEYKLSDDNKFIRFSIDTLGFQRVVTTTGSITKVFWSKEEDTKIKTSSAYSIPKGLIYADASIGYGKPGELVMGDGSSSDSKRGDNFGLLRFEQKMGLLGAATRMVTCGKFSASMVL